MPRNRLTKPRMISSRKKQILRWSAIAALTALGASAWALLREPKVHKPVRSIEVHNRIQETRPSASRPETQTRRTETLPEFGAESRRPHTRPTRAPSKPLSHEELKKFSVGDLEAKNLVDVFGGKHNPRLNRANKESVIDEWLNAFDGARRPGEKLIKLPELPAEAFVALSEASAEMRDPTNPRKELHPRTVVMALEHMRYLIQRGLIDRDFYVKPVLTGNLRGDSTAVLVHDLMRRVDSKSRLQIFKALGL